MKLRAFSMLFLAFVLSLVAVSARADNLQGDGNYAVLAESGITNAPASIGTQATIINGDIGLSPIAATACTGFVPCDGGPGIVNGTANLTTLSAANAITAFSGATGSYNSLIATVGAIPEGTGTLGVGSLTSLAPGTYSFTGTVTNLSGTLTLAGDGKANDTWIFEFLGSDTLTTGTNSSVVVTGAGTGAGVYFVAPQITLGVDSTVVGNYLSGSSVIFDLGAEVTCGRAFAQTNVTFAGYGTQINEVSSGGCSAGTGGGSTTGLNGGTGGGSSVPEPGTLGLLSSGLLGIIFLGFRKSRVSSLRAC